MNEEIKKYLACVLMVGLVVVGTLFALFILVYLLVNMWLPTLLVVALFAIAAIVYANTEGESLEFFRGLNPWRNKDDY